MKNTNPWVVAGICVPILLMVILDTTVVDVIIPHMMAALSVDYYDIQWVIISYMVAAAVTMPLFDWLSSRFSYRALFIFGTLTFVFASIACGRATSFYEMILSRIIQGMGEGVVVPTVTSLVFMAFPPEKRGLAMGLIGLGATMGPALGPTLGGYVTEHFSWRWAFYINVPIGFLLAFLAYLFLEEFRIQKKRYPLDWIGVVLCTTFLSTFLIAISKGQEKQWLSSDMILYFFIISAVSFILFVWREFTVSNPFIQLKVFKNKFFTLTMMIRFVFGGSIYGSFYLIPIYCEKLRMYPTLITGLIMLPGALTNGLGTVISGRLTDKLGGRWIMFFGIVMMSFAFYKIHFFDEATSKFLISQRLVFYFLFVGMVFTPLNYMSLAVLKEDEVDTGSALIHVIRFVSGSVGTAIATNRFEYMMGAHFTQMSSKLTYSNLVLYPSLMKLKIYLMHKAVMGREALLKGFAALRELIKLRSYIYAFQDVMLLFGMACLAASVLVLFLPNKLNLGRRDES